ncbi:serine/threonine-protein kinase Sgk2 [Trichoderma ceciliae]
MTDQTRSKLIEDNPIGNGLDTFRASFNSVCKGGGISCTPDTLAQLEHKDLQHISLNLLVALQNLSAASLIPSGTGYGTLKSDLLRLLSAVTSDDFDFDRIKPLLQAAFADKPQDTLVWDLVSRAVVESTPPPQPIASSLQQTPWRYNTSSFVNSSEYRRDVDRVLKEELGPLYIGLPGFCEAFFGGIADLDTMSEAIFQQCKEGNDPLFCEGWKGWPKDAKPDDVLSWFADMVAKIEALAKVHNPSQTCRRPLAQPNKPIQGSTGERKMDVGFVSDPRAGMDSQCHWSQILIPGELKSNPSADTALKTWLDLGRYAREVLAAQDTRRFVIGLTLCGSLMRIWEFDRLGGIASEQFDINKDGLQFVSTILAFLWLSEEGLGFDPTIIISGDKRYIEIERNGNTERIIIDRVMSRARCIVGRATTCWKAHHEKDPSRQLVIKDSWQYMERVEEGELLREATEKGVINVARYYYHETVHVGVAEDDIAKNVRKGLELSKATNYRPGRSRLTPSTSAIDTPGQSSSAGVKRPISEIEVALPPSKRPHSTPLTKPSISASLNRLHRRVILYDYGKPIYKASSCIALLASLEGCINGHESLYNAGILHRDISIGNLLINEDKGDDSYPAFLIDLDLAIRVQRERTSGTKGKTGTRAFMAIGALLGEQHSFMHDLESFFWVLFWICIHYNGPGRDIGPTKLKSWNYEDDRNLACLKLGTVGDESMFLDMMGEHFSAFYQPLIPCVNGLRKKVFPNGKRRKKESLDLYLEMVEVLREARELLESGN